MKFKVEFQYNILRFIVQDKTSKKCLKEKIFDEKMFDINEYKIVFNQIQSYCEKYDSVPTKINLSQYAETGILTKASQEIKEKILRFINDLYIPLGDDINYIKESIINYAQKTAYWNLMENTAKSISDEDDKGLFDKSIKEMYRIVDMPNVFNDDFEIFSLMNDYSKIEFKKLKGFPTKFPTLNNALESGGFRPQQIIVFASGPKVGKTSLLVNLAVDFVVSSHLKVLYIDTENGNNRIPRLSYKNILKCSSKELFDGFINKSSFDINQATYQEKEEIKFLKSVLANPENYSNITPEDALSALLDRYYMGFEQAVENALFFHIEQYKNDKTDLKIVTGKPMSTTIEDIYRVLENLKFNEGFIPDVIICDYFDNMRSLSVSKNANRREMSSQVYLDWKRLALLTNTLVLSVSQINRKGAEKKESGLFGIEDIAENFEKIAIVDSMIGFNTLDSKVKNLGILFNLSTRDGSKYYRSDVTMNTNNGVMSFADENVIPLKIDGDRCIIEEMTQADADLIDFIE